MTTTQGEIIKSTAGLFCISPDGKRVQARVEFYRYENGNIRLQPVSARNLSNIGKPSYVSHEEFENRPISSNSTTEAIWALNECGFKVCDVDDDFDDEL